MEKTEQFYKKYGEPETVFREYKILMALQQELEEEGRKYFPKAYGWKQMEDQSCLYLEYLKGKTLSEYMKDRKGKITKMELLYWMRETAQGLCYLHQMRPAVLWCDCKPSNLMVSNGRIRLIDFDASFRLKETAPIQSYGTKSFAAPEQKEGRILDERTDLYGYGSTFLSLDLKRIPLKVQRILKRCTAKEKERRYQTAAELLYDIQQSL